ncbi:MAG: HD-GYP domain-containing protein [Vallitaleaceae bacterium]|nr:HD-GYP domain-containing protein [Vallitaleaceae bacterium]
MYKKIFPIAILTTILAVFIIISGIFIINQNAWNQLKSNYIDSKDTQIQYYMDKLFTELEDVMFVNDYLIQSEDKMQLIGEFTSPEAAVDLFDGTTLYFDCVRICDSSGDLIQSFGFNPSDDIKLSTRFDEALSGNAFVRDIAYVNDVPIAVVMVAYYLEDSSEPAGVYSIGRYIDEEIIEEMEILMATDERLDITITNDKNYMTESKDYEEIMFTIPIYQDSEVFYHIHISTPELHDLLNRTRNYQILIMGIVAIVAVMLFMSHLKLLSRGIYDTVKKVKVLSESDYKTKIVLDNKYNIKEVNELVLAVNQITDEFNYKIKHIDAQYFSMIDLMADAVEINDAYTSFHNQSVGNYAKLIGSAIGYEDMDNLIIAGRLHDIGKIGIPSDILNKPGKLTHEEFIIVKRHPQIGFQLINSISFFDKAKYGIKYHHERWDGAGYPDGLKGDEIPLIAQIISIADVFDALTSDRPYREAMDCHIAMKIIQENKGKMFNPELVDIFSKLLGNMMEDNNADCILDIKHLLNDI